MPRKRVLKLPPIDLGDESMGERVTRLRKARGLTQVQLAKKMGLLQNLMSAYERGRLGFSAEMAARFAVALGVSTDELIGLRRKATNGAMPDRKLMRRIRLIQQLPPKKQKILLNTIDMALGGVRDEEDQ